MKFKDCPYVYILEEKADGGDLFWGIENLNIYSKILCLIIV